MRYLRDFVDMRHTVYNFLKNNNFSKMGARMSFLFSPKRKERAVEFIQITSLIKLETHNLPPDLPKSYVS